MSEAKVKPFFLLLPIHKKNAEKRENVSEKKPDLHNIHNITLYTGTWFKSNSRSWPLRKSQYIMRASTFKT